MNFGGKIHLNKLGICVIVGLIFFVVHYMLFGGDKVEKGNFVSLKKLLIASIESAVKGGKEVFEVNKDAKLNQRSKGKTEEGVDDPITDADEKSNCAMYYSLTHTFRDIKVISEEVSSESDCRTLQVLDLDQIVLENSNDLVDEEVISSDVTIWMDPLDATMEFTEKKTEYVTTMVCVAVRGKPVIGVIHFPLEKEPITYWAWVGRGVSSNLQKEQLLGKPDNPVPSIIVSRSHTGEVVNFVKQALGENVNITKAGGAGYKSIKVSTREVKAYIHKNNIKKWDICAGNAIINALGGKMTTLQNEDIDYSSAEKIYVANGIVASLEDHDKIIEQLQRIDNKN